MNFVENNGKKVAAVLCMASCLPVVATVYAMETEPGWHGDKYINEDTTVARGWQEIEGKTYYFSEDDGSVQEDVTRNAVVASVSASISDDVQESVARINDDAVAAQKEEEQPAEEEMPAAEEVVVADEVFEEVFDEPGSEVVNEPAVEMPAPEVPAEEEVSAPAEETPAPEIAVPEEEAPVVEQTPAVEQTPVVEQAPVIEQTPEVEAAPEVETAPETEQIPEVEQTPEVEALPENPAENEPIVDTTVQETPEVSAPSNEYADLNAAIAGEAQKLVTVTNGEQCTTVASMALANAGVNNVSVLWPDQYVQYGYYTDTPVAGNLIYYDNGGRGVDHIAVYIGDGMAVHGNFKGETIVYSVNVPGGAPQYIQVVQ